MARTLGDRLRQAIDRQPADGRQRGIGLLISKIKGVTGATYPSIQTYLADEVRPPLEFIAASAAALGVRPGWLAWDDGPMAEDAAPSDLMERLSQDAAARLGLLTDDKKAVAQAFYGAMRRLLWSVEQGDSITDPQVERVAELLLDVAREPYRRLMHRMPPGVGRAQQDHYVAMLHAMMLIMPEPLSVDSIETIIEKMEDTHG